jgi:hypothetical protein
MTETLLKQRAATRAKVTKVLSKIDNLLHSGDRDRSELESISKIISGLKESLKSLDLEISGHIDESEEEIEKTIDYEFKAQLGFEKISQSLSEPNSAPLPTRQDEVLELFREQNKITLMLADSHEKSLLPKREPETFDGTDLLKFAPFMRAFENLIANKTDSASERLYYLEQYTRGMPRELVRGCLQMEPRQGYSKAMTLLRNRYGNEFATADAYIKRLEAWPQIKQEDGKALESLAVFLTGVGHYVETTSSLNHLHSPREMHSIVMKLPYRLREKWRNQVSNVIEKGNNVEFADLVEFVNAQARLINLPVFGDIKDSPSRQEPRNRPQTKPSKLDHSNRTTLMATLADGQNQISKNMSRPEHSDTRCPCTNSCHALNSCPTFSALTYDEKRNFVMKNALCFGCFRVGHRSKDCRVRLTCTICHRKHPTAFHVEKFEKKDNQVSNVGSNAIVETKSLHTGAGNSRKVALALIPVKVKSPNQRTGVITYAALDNFSSDCFISEELLDSLEISGTPAEIKLTTLQGKHSPLRTCVVNGLEIMDLEENEKVMLPLVYSKAELPIDRDEIPNRSEISDFTYLNEVPFQFVDANVGLLIGMNVPDVLKPLEIVGSDTAGPYASRHKLGWALNGPLTSSSDSTHVHRIKIENRDHIENQLKYMWNHDYQDNAANEKGRSLEDRQWEKKVSSATVLQNGHYEVPLPFKDDDVIFPNNRDQALQRLYSTKRQLTRHEKFQEEYTEFMSMMLEKGFMERVPDDESNKPAGKTWYISHHAVYHKEKKKIRVVFNCSMKFHGISLNDKLLQGPDLTNNLLGVLIRFRQGNIALVGDIEKMFYQVKVSAEYKDFLRFWWFPEGDLDKEPVEYRLTVHVFGAVSSPSCANYALRRTALDHQEQFGNEVTDTILRKFYVDDMVTSIDDEDVAIKLSREVREVCAKGGFNLTKMLSNNSTVHDQIPLEHRATDVKSVDLDKEEAFFHRALGVTWDLQSDTFGYKIDIENKPATKRGILSTTFSIYDPFGFAGPAILPAKRVFQEACRLGLDWDEEIPESLKTIWIAWINDLHLLAEYKIPRCYRPSDFLDARCEIHIFCDASEIGYGAVAYLRFLAQGQTHCSLIMAKSRLAPLKKITIPRMELTAAKLAISMKVVLEKELDLKIDDFFFWTDSTAVLKYINNKTARFQRFVANRLEFIHEQSKPDQWNYVPSKTNPADHASRGLPITDFIHLDEWKHGPTFLWNESLNTFPSKSELNLVVENNDPEVKGTVKIKACQTKVENDTMENLFKSTSSWYRLKRRVAWLLKIKECLRSKTKLETTLSLLDLQNAEHAIILYVQQSAFTQEYIDIPKGRVKCHSTLKKLNPMIDEYGIIRVGGRISQSKLSWSTKHPIIFPKGHQVAELIMREQHLKSGCLGRNTVLSAIRQNFWIIGASRLIRKITSNCIPCRKQHGKCGHQLMAELPPDRVEGDQPPFTNVGIDYFGPFCITHGRKTEKRYGVIFTCLCSRAMHLELADSLDTDACINALRRFIARRGQVKIMRSDNGSNFVGAEKQLREEILKWNQNVISETMLKHNIEWIFNPPSASHYGGAWEREIRTIRKVLNGVLNMQPMRMTNDSLNTLFCEIESILNSRPLTTISDDPNDLEPLTPNHILLMKCGPTYPPGLFSSTDLYIRRRWKQVQYLADLFWSRWKKEYVVNLQKRQKWFQSQPSHSVGDLVLLVDNNLPRNRWALGRIVKIFPDEFGFVRQVTVKSVNFNKNLSRSNLIKCKPTFVEFDRPISKIVLLKTVDEM